MFNVGLGEMLVVALIALLVFGPDKLPGIMRNLGKALRQFQTEAQRATSVLKEGLEEPTTPNAPGVVDTPDAHVHAAEQPVADPPPASPEPEPEAPAPVELPVAREYEDT